MLAQECKNLKVRINAATALRAPSMRSQYGDHFTYIWRGVMVAMENAANVDDFTEYKHKDNLIEQVILYPLANIYKTSLFLVNIISLLTSILYVSCLCIFYYSRH